MSGYTVSAATVNNDAANAAFALREAFRKVQLAKAWFDAHSDAVLLAAPYSMPQADITELRNAMTDLDNLRLVGIGQRTQASVSDFWFNASKLLAMN